MPGVFLLLSAYPQSRLARRLSVLLVVLYSVTYLFIGVRSAAMMSLLGFAWLWEFRVGKLPRVFLIGTTALILCLLPCIAAFRNADTKGRSTLAGDAVSTVMSSPMRALLGETGNSMLTVAHTIDLFPSARPYDEGASYSYALLTVVPNVFGTEVHPSVAHGRLADWLVATIDPTIAAIGGGYGYSFIAEAYANFGIAGVIAFSLILGVFLQGLYSWTCVGKAAHRVAFTASILTMILIYVRGESGSIIRGLIWYGLLPYVAIHACERLIPYLRQTTGILPANENRSPLLM
jgi:oligosaccharide repeat unit polymerase